MSARAETGPQIELAVLDIAGTTVQEHGLVYDALAEAVGAAGAAVRDADLAAWMGSDKREAIAALLVSGGAGAPGSGEVERVHADFRRRLAAAYAARPPAPFPGVVDAFAALRARGVKLALSTGFDRGITDELLDVLGWGDGIVDAVVCGDDVPAGRPAPYMIFRAMELTGTADVRRVLVAGDTVRDLEAGTNAGACVVVGVLTGGHDAGLLGRARHTHLLPGVSELPTLIGAAPAR